MFGRWWETSPLRCVESEIRLPVILLDRKYITGKRHDEKAIYIQKMKPEM